MRMNSRLASVLGTTTALMALTAACGQLAPKGETLKADTPNGPVTWFEPTGSADPRKIFGTNDLLRVLQDGAVLQKADGTNAGSLPAQYRPLIDAFGKISMGCTATHIGNGLVLTAGHCFDAPATRTNNVACSEDIQWGLRHDKAAYLTSKCQTILAYEQNNNRDYAILRVSPVPPVSIPVDLNGRPALGTQITIFGHPQARPLEWSQTCDVQSRPQDGWGTSEFSHFCDTEPGNSGSTVITVNNPRVIGIHDGGDATKSNYATYLADTPIREYVGGPTPTPTANPTVTPRPTVTPPPTSQSFGPFAHNLDRVLTTLSSSGASTVTFTLSYNTERSYDFVYIVDGNGTSRNYSGSGTRSFSNLKTPVTVRITTDDSVTSQSVKLTGITYR